MTNRQTQPVMVNGYTIRNERDGTGNRWIVRDPDGRAVAARRSYEAAREAIVCRDRSGCQYGAY